MDSSHLQIYDWGRFSRDVRTSIRNCVLFLLLFYAANILAAGIIEVAYLLSDTDFIGSLFTGQIDLEAAVTESAALVSIVGIVAGGCVFFIPRGRRFVTDIFLPAAERLTPKAFIVLVVATQGFQFAYGLLTALIDALLPGGLSLEESYGAAMESLYTPMGYLYVVLVGPVFEELIFRGAIMGRLRCFGENFAILFSSLLFGLYHMIILQVPFGFVMGLLLGYACCRYSLRASIALHIIVNGISMLLSASGSEAIATIGGLCLIACAIATLILAIALRKPLRARINAGAPYYPHTYKNGFASISLWIFAGIMITGGISQMAMMPLL